MPLRPQRTSPHERLGEFLEPVQAQSARNLRSFHLERYLDEQVFRYNNRATKDNPLNDSDRFHLAMSQVAGRRLTYAQLTGKGTDALHHETAGTGQEEPF